MGFPKVMTIQNGLKTGTSCDITCQNSSKNRRASKQKSIDDAGTHIHHIVGHFGKFQFIVFLFKILIGATSAFNNLGISFFAPNDFVSHWCDQSVSTSIVGRGHNQLHLNHLSASPNHINGTTLEPMNYGILAHHHFVKSSIVQTFIFNDERFERHHSSNFTLKTPKKLRKECNYRNTNNDTIACKGFNYDKGIWLSTIIDEWDLVCNRSWMVSMTQSLYMSGFIVAYPFFGYISDRFGRWNSLLIGALIEMSAGFGCAFSNSITVFMIFRFLIGFGNAGRTSSAYLITIEWLGPKWRMEISTLAMLGWIFGYISLPWLTLFFLNFRHMQFFVGVYEFFFIVCLLFLPESPRWLLTHGRYDEARKVLLAAAKFNNLIVSQKPKQIIINDINAIDPARKNGLERNVMQKSDGQPEQNGFCCSNNNNNNNNLDKHSLEIFNIPSHNNETKELSPYTESEFDRKFVELVATTEAKEFSKNEDRLTVLDLLKWKNLRKYLLILFFIWSSNSFVYYGIVLRVGGDNLFVSYTIAGLMEIPCIFFSIICMKYLPRSTSNLIIYSLTGLLCLIQIPLKYYNYTFLLQCCIMLAKLSNSCAFSCILYQTMELFPTSIRQTAYSSCSLAGRIGSILAPFVKELAQKTNEFVPAILYALLSIMAVGFISVLPETKGADLHDTLMEAEKFEGTKPVRDEYNELKAKKRRDADFECESTS